jgi:hypothetical protein
MALAVVTPDDKPHPGKSAPEAYFFRFGTISLGIYPTNGAVITAAMFGLGQLVHLDLSQAGGRTYEWDKANSKIKAYRTGAGAQADLVEVTNATDLTAVNIRFVAIGK